MKVDVQLLEKQITEHVNDYLKRRQETKHASQRVLMISAVCSAGTTVLIGFSQAFTNPIGKIFGMTAFVTSAIVTIIGSYETLFNHKKLWILYTDHWILMKNLLMDLEHLKLNVEAKETDFERIYENFKSIRNSLQDQWKSMKSNDFKHAQQKLPADAKHLRS